MTILSDNNSRTNGPCNFDSGMLYYCLSWDSMVMNLDVVPVAKNVAIPPSHLDGVASIDNGLSKSTYDSSSIPYLSTMMPSRQEASISRLTRGFL